MTEPLKIAVLGGGWFGSHIAKELQNSGEEATLFEKNPFIFGELSGKFGVRAHAGPHYPRSPATRESCQRGLEKLQKDKDYSKLLVEHQYSDYALGNLDADNKPPKVDADTFNTVGQECKGYTPIDPEERGYTNVHTVMAVDEPSFIVGAPLREAWQGFLEEAGVKVRCNYEVTKVEKRGDKFIINGDESQLFDKVINTTSYKSLLPSTVFPFDMEMIYQPCVVLNYEDKKSGEKPISFTVMDGWFPCLMPYIDQKPQPNQTNRKYILYHGKWTPLRSFKTVKEADEFYATIDDQFAETTLRPLFEKDMKNFWPEFDEERFEYCGWQGDVLAKINSNKEFRSAVTFETPEGIITVIPGKINGIYDAADEAKALIKNQNIITKGDYRYVQGGTLETALAEITEKPVDITANTCSLQSYNELIKNEAKGVPICTQAPHSSFWSKSSDSEDGHPYSMSPIYESGSPFF